MLNNLHGWSRAIALLALLALAPGARAFGPDDAGVYEIYDLKNKKETDAAVRFYIYKEKWVAEERAKAA